jgi:hypothetical protein
MLHLAHVALLCYLTSPQRATRGALEYVTNTTIMPAQPMCAPQSKGGERDGGSGIAGEVPPHPAKRSKPLMWV